MILDEFDDLVVGAVSRFLHVKGCSEGDVDLAGGIDLSEVLEEFAVAQASVESARGTTGTAARRASLTPMLLNSLGSKTGVRVVWERR